MGNERIKTLLCVDDDENVLAAFKRVFHNYPYNLVTFDKPVEAIDQLQAINPDLIFLDVKMPKMDGYEFLEKLKNSGCGDVPVVMLTGEKESEQMLKGYSSGSAYYITKPTNKKYVLNIVEYFLGDISDERRREIECEL